MFCSNCGAKFADGSRFCPVCGTSTEGVVISGPTQQPAPSGMPVTTPVSQVQQPAPQPYQQPYAQPVPAAMGTFPNAAATIAKEFDGPLIIVAGALFCMGTLLEMIISFMNHNPRPMLWAIPLIAGAVICFVKPEWAPKGIVGALAANLAITTFSTLSNFLSSLEYSYVTFSYIFSLMAYPLILILFLSLFAAGVFDMLPNRNIAPIGLAALTFIEVIRTVYTYRWFFAQGELLYVIFPILIAIVSHGAYVLVCFAIQQNRNAAGQPITKRI